MSQESDALLKQESLGAFNMKMVVFEDLEETIQMLLVF